MRHDLVTEITETSQQQIAPLIQAGTDANELVSAAYLMICEVN